MNFKKLIIFRIFRNFRKSSAAHTKIIVCVLFYVSMFDKTPGNLMGPFFNDSFHAREPLYSKSAVIAWWSQSTSGKNVHLAVEKGNKFLNISLLRVFFADYCQ